MTTELADRGRHAIRPRLPLALLCDRPRAHGMRSRRSLHSDPRKEDQQHEGPAADSRADRARGQAAAVDLRRSGRRSAGHAGGQQASRNAQRLRRESPGLRRPPQSDAGRYLDPDRRQGHHGRDRHQARRRQVGRSGPRQARHGGQGQHHHHRRRAERRRTSKAGSSNCARRSKRPPPITIAKSCRSGWRSWPAAWRSSKSAPRPRPR